VHDGAGGDHAVQQVDQVVGGHPAAVRSSLNE
jgi:hypothetical protein